jgi:hypothetical protein
MVALLVAGAGCGFVACDDDDNGGPKRDPETLVVLGDYSGTMEIPEEIPAAQNEPEPGATELAASVTDAQVKFGDFPIRDLVVKFAGEEAADEIVAAIGKVEYAFAYTSAMADNKTVVTMTLDPKPLTLKYPIEAPEAKITAQEPTYLEIEVTIAADANGIFTVGSKTFGFTLSVKDIKLDGESMEDFEAFPLEFDLTKNEATPQ